MNTFYKIFVLFLIALASKAQTISAIEVSPNPFVERTKVSYTVQVTDTISIIIFNQYGQTVDTVLNNQLRVSGVYQDSVKMDKKPDGAYFLIIKDKSKVLVGLKIIKSISTEIVDGSINSFFTIYPNPVIDKLTIEYGNIPEVSSFIITNVLGQIIYSKVDLGVKQEIDFSYLPAAVYYIRLEGKFDVKVFKIIKL